MNSRTVLSMWVVLFVCVGPFMGAIIEFVVKGFTIYVIMVFNISVTITFINSFINLFYMVRNQ